MTVKLSIPMMIKTPADFSNGRRSEEGYAPDFPFRMRPLLLAGRVSACSASRCCGPAFTTSRMNRSKRGHASGTSSISASCAFFGVRAMPTYTYSLKYGLPLSEQHYTAIGEVAATWQYVELAVQYAIWAILGLDFERGRLATASLRFDTHLDILKVLAAQAEPNPTELLDLIAATKAVQDQRNSVIHGLWQWDETATMFKKLTHLRAARLRMKDAQKPHPTFTPEQITKIAETAHGLTTRWADFAAARIASQQKPEQQNPPPTM